MIRKKEKESDRLFQKQNDRTFYLSTGYQLLSLPRDRQAQKETKLMSRKGDCRARKIRMHTVERHTQVCVQQTIMSAETHGGFNRRAKL
jgi:hypothetical protein